MLPIDRVSRPSIVSESMALHYTSILLTTISLRSLESAQCER